MRILRIRWLIIIALMLAAGLIVLRTTHFWAPVRAKIIGKKTIADRLNEYGPAARARLAPYFKEAGVSFPPKRLVLLGLKNENRLEIYGDDASGHMRFVRSYPILAASGVPGPKLRRGDGQVPEGIYRIESLNPNSRFHLALRIGYPNEFDRKMAAADGRTDLGSDIMIHGSNRSIGCLAMGDEVAEDLFILATDTGIESITVILAPLDLRNRTASPNNLPWIPQLYADIQRALVELPSPP